MGLVSSTPLLEDARRNHYGIAAFNFHSFEVLQAIVSAAKESGSPLILQSTAGTVRHLGLDYIVAVTKVAAEKAEIPIALHLDHCRDYHLIVQAIRAGYTSVMIDASADSFAENVSKTKEVVKIAKPVHINVEAELGKVGGVEDDTAVDEQDACLADPEDCEKFVRLTEVSTLAPAVGTAHGMYKGVPRIDYRRIQNIADRVDVPLVLHGGSGIPERQLKNCVGLGMTKINFATELKHVFTQAIQQFFRENPAEKDPRHYMAFAQEAVQRLVKEKIALCTTPGELSTTDFEV